MHLHSFASLQTPYHPLAAPCQKLPKTMVCKTWLIGMEALKSKLFCYKLADTHNKNEGKKRWFGSSGWTAQFAAWGMTDALKSVRNGANHFSDKTNLSCAFHYCASKASHGVLGALSKSDVKTTLLLNVQHSTLIKSRLSLLVFLCRRTQKHNFH